MPISQNWAETSRHCICYPLLEIWLTLQPGVLCWSLRMGLRSPWIPRYFVQIFPQNSPQYAAWEMFEKEGWIQSRKFVILEDKMLYRSFWFFRSCTHFLLFCAFSLFFLMLQLNGVHLYLVFPLYKWEPIISSYLARMIHFVVFLLLLLIGELPQGSLVHKMWFCSRLNFH